MFNMLMRVFVQFYARQVEQENYNLDKCDYELLTDDYSVELLKTLAYYPEIVAQGN